MTSRPQMPSWNDIKRSNSSGALNTFFEEVLAPNPEDIQDANFETQDTPQPVMSTTTSSNPARPRTLKAGYDYAENKLIVVFRDGTWWEYRDVPEEVWAEFKAASSKGRYLKQSGLDMWPNMGPADVSNMPRHQRVMMNQVQETAQALYSEGSPKS